MARGHRPQVRRKAETLAAQEGTIPVFLKEAPNRWRYHGVMRFVSYGPNPQVVQATPGVDQREEKVAGVLTFERTQKSNRAQGGKSWVSQMDVDRDAAPDRSGSDSTPAAGRHFPAPGDENQGAFKLILSTPGTPSISHVWVNLAAVDRHARKCWHG